MNTKSRIIYRFSFLLFAVVAAAVSISWNAQTTAGESAFKPEKIDRLPVYGECDSAEEEERQKCSSVNIRSYFKHNMVYPSLAKEQKIEGKVVVECTINEDGEMEDVHVQKTANKELNAEALRLCNALGKWSPALRKKKPVPARIFIPVNFSSRSEAFKK